MTSGSENNPLPVHKRIIFWLLLPVIVVGIAISGVLIGYLSPPMESFLIEHFEANLRLASNLGIKICETHFNQLLDMRLEDNPEMNTALKNEALSEIKSIGRQVPNVHIMVLEGKQSIRTISIDFEQTVWGLPATVNSEDAIQDIELGEEIIKAHVQYFPFWDWHIISFVYEKEYLAPISIVHKIVYMSTLGVLVAVFITLLIVFHLSVTKPLNRLIDATKAVTQGKLQPVNPIYDNEIGQLMDFFNKMIESLKRKTGEIGRLIERLKESEVRYRSLVELSPEAVIVHQEGVIKYINRSGAKIFGAVSPNELIDRPLMGLIHPDFHDDIAFQINMVQQDHDKLPPHELKFLTIDKQEIEVEAMGAYIDYAGKQALLTVIRDITERKRAEEAIREGQEKLMQSKKMESLGLLAGGVAHDLNNVLSGIVSYPELILLDLPEDSSLRKPILAIKDSGERATAIVQDLLTLARGVATAKEVLNLNDLVSEYANSPEFKTLVNFHPNITIKKHLDSDLFNINGSPVHIRKAVMNLVANAAEAVAASGNVTISTLNRYVDNSIKGYNDVKEGEYAVLSVWDDGPGISSDELKRIFEPFYTKKVMGRSGTGLGLAVVWNVVQDHQGYIDVITDEIGKAFELYFPITRDKTSDKSLSLPINAYKGSGETILVVDDVESQREISCRMLDRLGYKTKAVSSGVEAVEYLKVHSADLILLDMIMDPGINGRETYKRVIEIHPNQKTIIVSGFSQSEEVKETQKMGAGQYIKKPLSIEKLGLAVKEALRH